MQPCTANAILVVSLAIPIQAARINAKDSHFDLEAPPFPAVRLLLQHAGRCSGAIPPVVFGRDPLEAWFVAFQFPWQLAGAAAFAEVVEVQTLAGS
jgi:hypothetical protein